MSAQHHPVDDEQLPPEITRALTRAVRLEWLTIGTLAVTVTLVFLVLGNSQAMKTAWVEDLLSFIPPIAFLVGVRITRRPATAKHPFGHHRSVGMAHLVSATALLVMGTYLIVDSGGKLITAEHPSIGGIQLFGTTVWLGWLMIGVLVVTGIPPVVLGRMKLKLATPLHNKVLFADADMNKADWMTSAAATAGVIGIGLGWWWADAVAAIVIAVSILKDGITNLRAAVAGLADARPTTVDNKKPHPLNADVDAFLRQLEWARVGAARVRDEGQVFQVEGFVVPRTPDVATPDRLDAARKQLLALDWKIRDVVLIPVNTLPRVLEAEEFEGHSH
ncbi:cation diffusion facilitator family transporter [Kocuria sp. KRD140]|uniref:cation diffusion facilitator family transporter n=1 Tax=Kocuria sp. KRD140 TaxID=2729723 RepID=UPI0019D1A7EE|nr:cation diffusion facilitator family transporter [Kocuria sp. KRD140]